MSAYLPSALGTPPRHPRTCWPSCQQTHISPRPQPRSHQLPSGHFAHVVSYTSLAWGVSGWPAAGARSPTLSRCRPVATVCLQLLQHTVTPYRADWEPEAASGRRALGLFWRCPAACSGGAQRPCGDHLHPIQLGFHRNPF